MIDAYLAIERVRFGDRIDTDVRLPAELADARIPAFLLQPLVENAVQHGLFPKLTPGKLLITACKHNDIVEIAVIDNGIGIEPAKLEQLFSADVVIFNRCDDSTDKGKYRRNVKALNRKAQLVYERADGTLDERPEELPFDITADEIEISDADYAIWYMDCQDNPKKYEGKKVSFLALVYNPDKLKKGIMVPGRFAMTCCVEDVTFIGFKTKYDREDEIPHKSWINITAEVHVEFAKEYKGKGPVLYPISITPAEKPEDELVYFS